MEAYFLGNRDEDNYEKHRDVIDHLEKSINIESQKGSEAKQRNKGLSNVFEAFENLKQPSPFMLSIKDDNTAEEGQEPQKTKELSKNIKEAYDEIRADLVSFKVYFLVPEVEGRLARDLQNGYGGKHLMSGDTRNSFVSVSPDFANFEENNYLGDSDISSSLVMPSGFVQDISAAYTSFFQSLDTELLKSGSFRSNLESYWRVLGQALRQEHIYSSFEDPATRLRQPNIAKRQVRDENGLNGNASVAQLNARPQNIFLRVKICDSFNEPMIDGLFVFTKDFDEVNTNQKVGDLRKEDLQDLLSFAKVYFFCVRDYFKSQDSARDSRDIGRLNQALYDERIAELDQTMEARLKSAAYLRNGLSNKTNRNMFIYEVINKYAEALIRKPRDIRNETFPFDRLLVLPLSGSMLPNQVYQLPFYLFQSIYIELESGKINPDHYSLVKPFQSPIEQMEKGERNRFRLKSFQEVSTKDRKNKSLDHLEKHYLGGTYLDQNQTLREHRDKENETEPLLTSFVLKATPTESKADTGWRWVREATRSFWKQTGAYVQEGDHRWLPILDRLTAAYHKEMVDEMMEEMQIQDFCDFYLIFHWYASFWRRRLRIIARTRVLNNLRDNIRICSA